MRSPVASVSLLAGMLLAGAALAGTIPSPEPPAMLVFPGATVVTRLPALPAGIGEVELLLLPEGGAPVRVSPERSAGVREIRWRMPLVAAPRARLVLQAGDRDAEWRSEPSAPFALGPLPASELSRLLAGRSEAGPPALEAELPRAGLDAGPARSELSLAGSTACALAAPDAPAVPEGSAAGPRRAVPRAEPRPRLRAPRAILTPFVPLRI